MFRFFTHDYWQTATSNTKNLKMMSICALLIALQIAVSTLYIPIAENLRIYGTFFIVALYSTIGGPILAVCSAFIADTIGFLIHPTGAYFFGYTLSAMLGAFIYSLFFYKSKITIIKIIVCKLLVNVLVNATLGSLWTTILYTKGFYFYFSASLTKNLILLPFECLLLYFVYKALLPYLYKKKLVTSNKITNL